MRKKFLAGLLALVMLLSLVPMTAFAAEGEARTGVTGGTTNSNGMVLTKTAQLQPDGTYTINLEAFATGTTTVTSTTVATPLDVVIIVDQSGSMEGMVDDLQSAVTSFVNTIKTDATTNSVNHRIALVGFASGNANARPSEASNHFQNTEIFIGSKQYNYAGSSGYSSTENAAASTVYSSAFQDVTTTAGQNNLTASIAAFTYGGATFPQYAFEMTNGIFNANSNIETKEDGTQVTRKRVVVFFTDGEPKKSSSDSFRTSEANATISKAYTTKNTYGATVYTVGLYDIADSTNITAFMNRVSSNYPTAQSMSNTVTTYTAVTGTPSTSGTYYYKTSSGSYERAYYCSGYDLGGLGSEAAGWFTQEHGTFSHGGERLENVQFYTATTSTVEPTKAADKYYMTTSDSSELEKIFDTISQDAISSGTTVTLTEEAVMRDIMTPGAFQLPKGFTAESSITVKTQVVTTTDDATYTPDPNAVTKYTHTGDGTFTSGDKTITVTANTETDTVDVTGFDYAENYVSTAHPGNKLMITITGVEATEGAATGETVYTNDENSGIYENGQQVTPIVKFPSPDTVIDSKSYVLDYAKQFDITDLNFGAISHVDSSMAKIIESETKLDLTNGYVEKTGNNKLTYTPQTMNWNSYDKFFAFGTGTESPYHWSQVNVIPANNVYYEDTFVSTEKGTAEADAVVGISYGDNWKIVTDNEGTEGAEGTATETPDGAVMGWEQSLSDDTAYSDGAAHETGTAGATAAFTFTGTGVDIYSRTNMDSGIIVGILYKEGEDKPVYETDENGDVRYYYGGDGGHEVTKGEDGKWYYEKGGVKYEAPEAYVYPMVKTAAVAQQTLMVDNLAVSGDYYQVPTLSFQNLEYGSYVVRLGVRSAKAPLVDSDGSIVTEPVVMTNEDGTTYTVNRIVYDESGVLRSTYYLDGIRIYNPLGQTVTDDTVVDAYVPGADQIADSIQSVFTEVRTILDAADDRMVFIDMNDDGKIGATDYGPSEVNNTYGPKNEVYLDAGDSIVFAIDGYDANNLYYVGLKSLTGDTVKAAFTDDASGVATDIAHTTDLYYKVTPAADGIVIVRNASTEEGKLLSVTKIQAVIPGAATFTLRTIASEEAETYAAAFMGFELGEYQQPVVEEPVEPEIPEEPTEPETPEVPDIDIEIENPESKPEKPPFRPILHHNLKKLVNNLFNQIHGWFGR